MQPQPHAATGVDKVENKHFCAQHIFWEGEHSEWPPILPGARSHCSAWKRGPETSREASVTLVLLRAQLTSSCPKLVSLIWTLRRRCPRAWGQRSSSPDPPPRRALLPPCCRSRAAPPTSVPQPEPGGPEQGRRRSPSSVWGQLWRPHSFTSPLPRPTPATVPSRHTPRSPSARQPQPFATETSSAPKVSNSQVERPWARLAQEKERRHNEQNTQWKRGYHDQP